MHFFYTQISENKITNPRVVHQIGIVLRGKIGDKFIIFDGEGIKKIIQINKINRNEIIVKIIKEEKLEKDKKIIRLFQGLPKIKSKWEFILQKGTEIGANEFIPIKTEFSNAKYPLNTEREKSIIIEASEQCERIFLPTMHKIHDLNEIFDKFGGKFYFFDSLEKNLPDQFDIQEEIKKQNEINIIIGSEGGFSGTEIDFIKKQKNCTSLSLGKNILRLETAVIVALGRIKI